MLEMKVRPGNAVDYWTAAHAELAWRKFRLAVEQIFGVTITDSENPPADAHPKPTDLDIA